MADTDQQAAPLSKAAKKRLRRQGIVLQRLFL